MTGVWQYNMLKLVSGLVCLLPYPLLLVVGKMLGRLYYYIAVRQRQRALDQVETRLQVSPAEARRIIRRHFIKISQAFLEVMYIPTLTPAKMKQYVKFENRQYLDQALAEGKGVAVLSAHLGNWEWLGAGLAMAGYPIASIVKDQPNAQHTRFINEYRQMTGIEIFTRGTTELVAAAKALRKGKILGFFCDQDAGPGGVFVEFLGKMASSPAGLAIFSRKFEIPIVPVFIIRRPEGGHRIIANPPLWYEKSADETADIYSITFQTTKIIEEMIRRCPDEWLWFQRRWNTEWAGEQA